MFPVCYVKKQRRERSKDRKRKEKERQNYKPNASTGNTAHVMISYIMGINMEIKVDDYYDSNTSLNQSLIQTTKIHLTLLKYVTISFKSFNC